MLRNIHVVAYRKDTPHRDDAPPRYDHSPVVERRVLEEYVLDQARIDVGVYDVARLLVVVERHLPLEAYQRTRLRLRHRKARVDHCHHESVIGVGLLRPVMEDALKLTQMPPRSYLYQETLYLVLEKNHEHYEADAHELVEYRARKLHVEDLGSHHPDHDEEQHAVEETDRPGALHKLIYIEEQSPDYQNVKYVFYSKRYHQSSIFNH